MTAAQLSPNAVAGGGGTHINRWWFVVAGFITMIVGVNTVSSLFNVLGATMSKDLGFPASTVSGGLSLFIVLDGCSVFATGWLADRIGIRRISIILSAVFGLGMISLSIAPAVPGIFLLQCAIMGAGVGPATQVAYSIVIRAWFGKTRGLALGILAVGLGVNTTIIPLIGNALLGSVGWRGTWAIIGVIAIVINLVGFVFIVRMPAQYEQERKQALAEKRTVGMPFRQIVRENKRAFWLVSVSIFLFSAGSVGVLGQIVPIATGQGVPVETAVFLLSVSGISSIASRFVVGALLDRVFAPILAAVFFALCGVGLVLLVTQTSVPLLFVAAIFIGFGPGAETDVIAYLLSRYVPVHSYGRIYGFVVFLYAQGVAVGIFALGVSFSLTGSAYVAATGIIIMVAISAVLIAFAGPYKYRVDGTPISGPVGLIEHHDGEKPEVTTAVL